MKCFPSGVFFAVVLREGVRIYLNRRWLSFRSTPYAGNITARKCFGDRKAYLLHDVKKAQLERVLSNWEIMHLFPAKYFWDDFRLEFWRAKIDYWGET
jgi:hypothetical protein